jgi:diguanylate cyclase (GGDEF)-like protein
VNQPFLPTPSSRGRVLVVDDALVCRAIVAKFLRRAGYEVEEAEDGRKALARLDQADFDVVVTDIQMPEADGFRVLESVVGREDRPEVILLTGTHAETMQCAVQALRLGAHDYLSKPPAGPDQVVETVDRARDKKRLRDANRRQLAELDALARTDALTGLQNRRAFDEALRREQARAARHGVPLSLILADLDHFKAVNDVHGHPAGDAVLRSFAASLGELFREGDGLFRFGGEEFAVLLPHADLPGAIRAARRLVAATARRAFTRGTVVLRLTCSVGVACFEAPAGDLGWDLVSRADAALYTAKRDGRSRAHGQPLSEGVLVSARGSR